MEQSVDGGDTPPDVLVAAVFRAVLQLGVATPADLVPWADDQVMTRERPPAWVLELSLGAISPAERARSVMEDAAFHADPVAVFRLLVGLIDVVDGWDFFQADHACAWMARLPQAPIDPELSRLERHFGYAHDDGYYGAPDALVSGLDALVRRYADPAARAWLPDVRVRFDDA